MHYHAFNLFWYEETSPINLPIMKSNGKNWKENATKSSIKGCKVNYESWLKYSKLTWSVILENMFSPFKGVTKC